MATPKTPTTKPEHQVFNVVPTSTAIAPVEFLKLGQLEDTVLCGTCKTKLMAYCNPVAKRENSAGAVYVEYVKGLLEGKLECAIPICRKCTKVLPQCQTCGRWYLNDKAFFRSRKSLVLHASFCYTCSTSTLSDKRLYFLQPTVELTKQEISAFTSTCI